MKKRMINLFLLALCCICLTIPAAAYALPTTEWTANVQRMDLEDGGYCIIGPVMEAHGAVIPNEKTGQQTATYYTSSGQKIFSVTVFGTFTYNGTMASATSAEVGVTIYDANAVYVTASATTRGGTASATGTVKYDSVERTLSVSLTCSKNGVLS